LYVLSPDKNVLIIAHSLKASRPSPEDIKQNLPLVIKRMNATQYSGALYAMHQVHGIPLYTGFTTFQTSTHLGTLLLEEGYTNGRLYLVAGVVVDAQAPHASDNLDQMTSVVTSLNPQPSVLDVPSG